MSARNSFYELQNAPGQKADVALRAKEPERIAAFFDLDGTLLRLPSLEKRFFRSLRYRRILRAPNYLHWLSEAARLLPVGIKHVCYANKMYLRGVRVSEANHEPNKSRAPEEAKSRAANGQGSTRNRAQRKGSVTPSFFLGALRRMAWHAERGHAILIVSGTLQPLAMNAAAALEEYLAAAGIQATIGVYATHLEERDGVWTGRIVGEAMFAEAKARATKQIAASRGFDLARCFAYGDSASDRWMLESVGKPSAVNPSNDLARIAHRNGWPILQWRSERPSSTNSQALKRPCIETGRQHLQAAHSKPGTCS